MCLLYINWHPYSRRYMFITLLSGDISMVSYWRIFFFLNILCIEVFVKIFLLCCTWSWSQTVSTKSNFKTLGYNFNPFLRLKPLNILANHSDIFPPDIFLLRIKMLLVVGCTVTFLLFFNLLFLPVFLKEKRMRNTYTSLEH